MMNYRKSITAKAFLLEIVTDKAYTIYNRDREPDFITFKHDEMLTSLRDEDIDELVHMELYDLSRIKWQDIPYVLNQSVMEKYRTISDIALSRITKFPYQDEIANLWHNLNILIEETLESYGYVKNF